MAPKSRAAQHLCELCSIRESRGVVKSSIPRSLWSELVFSGSQRSKKRLFRRRHRDQYLVCVAHCVLSPLSHITQARL